MEQQVYEIGHRYQLLEKIKEDAYFHIYVAYDKLRRSLVRIKLLDAQYIYDFKFLEDLRKILHVAFRLSHPHLIKPVDFGRDSQTFFIVEEHDEGEYLDRLLAKEGWTVQNAVNVIFQAGSALRFLEGERLIHGGIRSSCIYVSKHSGAKIGDLGVLCIKEEKRLPDIHAFGVLIEEVFFRPAHRLTLSSEKERFIRFMVSRAKQQDAEEGFSSISQMMLELKPLQSEDAELKVPAETSVPVPPLPAGVPEAIMLPAASPAPAAPEQTAPLPEKSDETETVVRKTRPAPDPSKAKVQRVEPVFKQEKSAESPPFRAQRKPAVKPQSAFLAAAALALLFAMVKLFYHFFPPLKDVQVPNLVGRTDKEAMELLNEKKFKFRITGYAYSDKYPKDTILWQGVIPGTMMKEGKTVLVRVSHGLEMISVPDVQGISLTQAKDRMFQAKLKAAAVKSAPSATVEKGKILSQDPPPGNSVPVGTKISLLVSTGPEKQKVKVPNVVGLPLEEGKNMLKEALLATGSVTSRETADAGDGEILTQSPSGGEEILEGEKVSFVVAKKPKEKQPETTEETAPPSETTDASVQKEKKQADVDITIPPGPARQLVKIVVLDADGARTIYQKFHKPQDKVKVKVNYAGKATIQVYMDDELVKAKEL